MVRSQNGARGAIAAPSVDAKHVVGHVPRVDPSAIALHKKSPTDKRVLGMCSRKSALEPQGEGRDASRNPGRQPAWADSRRCDVQGASGRPGGLYRAYSCLYRGWGSVHRCRIDLVVVVGRSTGPRLQRGLCIGVARRGPRNQQESVSPRGWITGLRITGWVSTRIVRISGRFCIQMR